MHILTILMDYMGLTQAELAKRADISPADLNEMINKAPYGMITKYHRLAQYLFVSVDSIVNNDILSISEIFFTKHRHGPYLKTPSNKQAALGREAEEAVFQMEKERVMTFSPTLSKLVLPYYKMRASSPGYDILSYSFDGSPIFIEVKNSVKNNIANFHLTSHEFDVANKATDVGLPYLVYIFSGWKTKNQQLDIRPFKKLQNENRITAGSYICNLRELRTEVNGITYYRMMNKLSQIDLATTLDIPPASLCKYELGENICPVTVYQRLATFFQVKIDDLLKYYPNPNNS